MKSILKHIGVDGINLVRMLNCLPYPVLLSEQRDGVQHNVFVNRNFVEEIGYSVDEIPTIADWFEKAYPDNTYRSEIISEWKKRELDAKESGNESIILQARIHTKTREYKWYEVKASMHGPIHFVAFVDIDSEIIRERELERLNENKNIILSILSHDLRSPLHNLNGILDLALSGHLTEGEKTDTLKKLSGQVFQLTEFLDTTLLWTKMNFTALKIDNADIDVMKLTESILGLYQNMIQSKEINVKRNIERSVRISSDPELFSILIRNLISNAIKYTPNGGAIHIQTSSRNGKSVFAVENSGNGISREKISTILGKDYVSERGTNGEKGLGLGLKLCQQLLTAVGGNLEIESPHPASTIFRIVV